MQWTKCRSAARHVWVVVAALVAACSGGDKGTPSNGGVTGPSTAVTSVVVSPSTLPLTSLGVSGQLSATVGSAAGAVSNPTIAWTSSDPAVATVGGSGPTATVTSVSPGTATITATSGGITGTATVTVAQAAQALSVTIGGAGGGTVASTPAGVSCASATCTETFAFGSQVMLTATPNAGSTFTGWTGDCTGAGVCTVVTDRARTVTVAFAVRQANVATITVTPATDSLDEGQSRQYTAVLKDAAGNVLTGRTVTWTSSDTTVATVSATGRVTGVVEGAPVKITATSEGVSASATTAVRSLFFLATSISTGSSHTCAVRATGGAYCWGANNYGQIGNPKSGLNSGQRYPIAGDVIGVAVSTGGSHSCALASSGSAYCWGDNFNGSLGNTAYGGTNSPVPVSGGYEFRSITSGGSANCALTAIGVAYCWGNNVTPLGVGASGGGVYSPLPLVGGHRFSMLAMGGAHCGIEIGGILYCWGYNVSGQLGDGTTASRSAPTAIASTLKFTTVSLGSFHTCAVETNGAAYCWGSNSSGQLGNGTFMTSLTPSRVAGGLLFTEIAAGGNGHTCAITTTGDAYCWGVNDYGQLGVASPAYSPSPVKVNTTARFTAIAAGSNFTCAIATTKQVFCWGGNGAGQLGFTQSLNTNVPTPVQRP